MFGKDV